jgi:hypothetical protein
MTIVSSIISEAARLDNLKDGVIVRLKAEDDTSRSAVAESSAKGRVWRVSGASDIWSSDDLLDVGTVIVVYLPEN